MAQQALGLVREIDPGRKVTIANRNTARAREVVANDADADAASLSRTIAVPPPACLVIAATSSEELVLDLEAVHRLRRQLDRRGHPDAHRPGAASQHRRKARDLSRVELHGIEEMREESEHNRQLRAAEIDCLRAARRTPTAGFRNHLLNRELSPAAQTLKGLSSRVAEKTLDRSFSRELGTSTRPTERRWSDSSRGCRTSSSRSRFKASRAQRGITPAPSSTTSSRPSTASSTCPSTASARREHRSRQPEWQHPDHPNAQGLPGAQGVVGRQPHQLAAVSGPAARRAHRSQGLEEGDEAS